MSGESKAVSNSEAGPGFYEQKRGLISVWGKEAVQFLDGLISNDMKTLADGHQMLAAFPNAQGRLLAVVRVLRQGDRFMIETEDATRERLYENLFRSVRPRRYGPGSDRYLIYVEHIDRPFYCRRES